MKLFTIVFLSACIIIGCKQVQHSTSQLDEIFFTDTHAPWIFGSGIDVFESVFSHAKDIEYPDLQRVEKFDRIWNLDGLEWEVVKVEGYVQSDLNNFFHSEKYSSGKLTSSFWHLYSIIKINNECIAICVNIAERNLMFEKLNSVPDRKDLMKSTPNQSLSFYMTIEDLQKNLPWLHHILRLNYENIIFEYGDEKYEF